MMLNIAVRFFTKKQILDVHFGFGCGSCEIALIVGAFQNVQINCGYRMRLWQARPGSTFRPPVISEGAAAGDGERDSNRC